MNEEHIRAILEEVQLIKILPHMMFNAAKFQTLSDYVDLVFENNEYFDNEVMLALLRLFCFYPHCYDRIKIKKILISALYNINDIDMNSYLSLINSNLYDENIRSVVYLHDLIQKCRFKQLWECIYDKDKNESNYDFSFLMDNDNFTNNMRKFILDSITLSYESISLSKMAEYLNIPDLVEVEKVMNLYNWTLKKVNHKGEEMLVCYNQNIENGQVKKNIDTYFRDDNIKTYINALKS